MLINGLNGANGAASTNGTAPSPKPGRDILRDAAEVVAALDTTAVPLPTMMETWEAVSIVLQALGEKIEQQVMALGRTQVVGRCRATYSNGRGKVDYEAMSKKLQPPRYIIDKHTTPTVDWLAVCRETVADSAMDKGWAEWQDEFYAPGMPYVSIKLEAVKKPARGRK